MPIDRQCVIPPEQFRQFFHGFAVSLRDFRQMCPQRLDGFRATSAGRKCERQDWSAAMVNGLLGIRADACREVQQEDEDYFGSEAKFHVKRGEARSLPAIEN